MPDPSLTSAAIGAGSSVADKYGFNALLVLALLGGGAIIGLKLIRMFVAHIKEMEASHVAERDAAATDRRAEREESREAHLGALREITTEIRDLRQDLRTPGGNIRLRGG